MASAHYVAPAHDGSGLKVYADPKNWSFFENGGQTFWLDHNLAARIGEDSSYDCPFLYIGRRYMQGKVSSVKLSVFMAQRLLHWLDPILDQIHQFEGRLFLPYQLGVGPLPAGTLKLGVAARNDLIPYFGQGQEAETRAFQTPDKENRQLFWEKDIGLDLGIAKLKLVFDQIVGQYQLYILNPVSTDIQEKHKGWCGPQVVLREHGMIRLRRLIKRSTQPDDDEVDAAASEDQGVKTN